MPQKSAWQIETLSGAEIEPYLAKLAELRIQIFREFPYLYAGNLAYEQKYLAGLARQKDALLIAVKGAGRLIGAGTALPLATDYDILAGASTQFLEKGLDPSRFFYYSEILIEHEWRGRGISREIYRRREAFAAQRGFTARCFAAVLRDPQDPRRPANYFSPEPYWRRMGFEQRLDLRLRYQWPTLQTDGSTIEADHELAFWLNEPA